MSAFRDHWRIELPAEQQYAFLAHNYARERFGISLVSVSGRLANDMGLPLERLGRRTSRS